MAAAHAACYAMALNGTLGRKGASADRTVVRATVTADKGDAGIKIQSSKLEVTAYGLKGLERRSSPRSRREAERPVPGVERLSRHDADHGGRQGRLDADAAPRTRRLRAAAVSALTVLATGRSLAGICGGGALSAAAMCVFLAHEPALVLLGQRGTRAAASRARVPGDGWPRFDRARRRLWRGRLSRGGFRDSGVAGGAASLAALSCSPCLCRRGGSTQRPASWCPLRRSPRSRCRWASRLISRSARRSRARSPSGPPFRPRRFRVRAAIV